MAGPVCIMAPCRRPLGPMKALLRQARLDRHARLLQRGFSASATRRELEATPSNPSPAEGLSEPTLAPYTFHKRRWGPTPSPVPASRAHNEESHKAFAVYPSPPTPVRTYPNPLPEVHARQISRLDPTGARALVFDRSQPDCAKVGDVLVVFMKAGNMISGACLDIRRRGSATSILLRTHMARTPVEVWLKIFSPKIAKIEIAWRRPKRARRARLTYMRKPKHDMGNVDHLVRAWREKMIVIGGSKGGKDDRGGKHGAKR